MGPQGFMSAMVSDTMGLLRNHSTGGCNTFHFSGESWSYDEVLFPEVLGQGLHVFFCSVSLFQGVTSRTVVYVVPGSATSGPTTPLAVRTLAIEDPSQAAMRSLMVTSSREDFKVNVDDDFKLCMKAGSVCEMDAMDWRTYGDEIIHAIISDKDKCIEGHADIALSC